MKAIKKTIGEFSLGAMIGIFGAMITIPFTERILQGFKVSHIFAIVVLVVVSFLFSILIHELGHLVMGLMTGYKFLSFRFLTFHVQHDENGKLKLYKQNIPGTMGQCLMIPPKKKPFPMFWYNFGGVFFNLIISILALAFMILTRNYWFLIVSLVIVIVNLFMGLTNWMPMGGLQNDGTNHRTVKKNDTTREALYYLLDINAQLTQGLRLTEINTEGLRALNFDYKDDIQLNVTQFLYSQDILLGDEEAYHSILEMIYPIVKDRPGLISILIKTEYYFSKLLNGNVEAGKFKTTEVRDVLKRMGTNGEIGLIKLYEYYVKEGVVNQELLDGFVSFTEKSTYTGHAQDLKEFAFKILGINDIIIKDET